MRTLLVYHHRDMKFSPDPNIPEISARATDSLMQQLAGGDALEGEYDFSSHSVKSIPDRTAELSLLLTMPEKTIVVDAMQVESRLLSSGYTD